MRIVILHNKFALTLCIVDIYNSMRIVYSKLNKTKTTHNYTGSPQTVGRWIESNNQEQKNNFKYRRTNT